METILFLRLCFKIFTKKKTDRHKLLVTRYSSIVAAKKDEFLLRKVWLLLLNRNTTMLNSLDTPPFFTPQEIASLREIGLWQESHTTPAKLAYAGLILSPIMQLVMADNATTTAEFEAVQKFVTTMERSFELATRSDIESIGTDMGLLPMLKSTWDNDRFMRARTVLAGTLDRLTEVDAHDVRTEISRAVLSVARAGSSHMISLHMLDKSEREVIHQLVHDLHLEKCAEGLTLMDKAGD